ncbi:MAG: RNA pseudouridine synthase [Myxococcota bacterium]
MLQRPAAWRSPSGAKLADPTASAFDAVPGALVLRDGPLLVWDKPPDLPTSGRSLDDDDCLQFHLMRAHGAMVWAVHQLDADTSGLNVFVTAKCAVAPTAARMQRPEARKRYLAVVHGVPSWDATVVDAPIGYVDARSLGVAPEGKPARTELRVRTRGPAHSLLEAELKTGRTHQIRIHLQHLGLSLVGEEWYRETPCLAHPRQALHAWRLDGLEPGPLEARFPPDLMGLAARLGCADPSL